jgi:DNA-binding NtrC family response regulator
MDSKILVIDDDSLVTTSLKRALSKETYNVEICENGYEVIEYVNRHQPDMILLDIFLGDVNGIDVLKQLQKDHSQIPVVMITGYADVQTAVTAIKLGAIDFILKPINLDQLELIIAKTLKHVMLQKEVNRLRLMHEEGEITRDMFGKSKAIVSTLDAVQKISKSDSTTILIEGESGSGKEMIAKFIHYNSPRRNGSFITVNCGAIPRELAESEFFGSEKGAYTGAGEKTRMGKFELADGGTIMLDEIAELNLDLQVKLLRVLQDRKFFRLGGTKEINVNVRVIAATNKDLRKCVEEKIFREDLFYRLNVATVYVPPLRFREGDVSFLAYSFLDEFNKAFGKEVKRLDPELLDMMQKYNWPGNVRELRNSIERAVLLMSGDTIRPDHMKFIESDKLTGPQKGEDKYLLNIPKNGISIDVVLRDLIIKTLDITGGNQVRAAKILGLSRSKLRYRMEQLNLEVKRQIINDISK